MDASRISKIAGLSLAGVVAAAIAADKANLGPVASQIAGFAGAFIVTLAARRRTSKKAEAASSGTDVDGPRPEN